MSSNYVQKDNCQLIDVLAKTVNNYKIVFLKESAAFLIALFSDSNIHITVEWHICISISA